MKKNALVSGMTAIESISSREYDNKHWEIGRINVVKDEGLIKLTTYITKVRAAFLVSIEYSSSEFARTWREHCT